MNVSRARDRSRRKERGAVIVEFAIMVPFLLLLVLGAAELGFRTHSAQTLVGATRSAARVSSSAGDDRLADYVALQALAGSLRNYDPASIERIIIFNAASSDGAMPAGCEIAAVANQCNHYDGADLALVVADFTTSGSTCGLGAPDAMWCPLDRNALQYPGADWIGVEVWVQRESITPFLSDQTLNQRTIMRLEPRYSP